MAQLRHNKTRFEKIGAGVLIVGMGTQTQTEEFKRQFKVPYPMVCDPDKRIYQAFGIGQVSLLDALNPGVAIKGLSAMAKGHRIGVPKGDVRQLSGVFIIDTDGYIRYCHYAKNPADHPEVDEILGFLQ